MNENVATETPMLTNEPTTVNSKKDACALPVTVNTKSQEIFRRLANQLFCLFVILFLQLEKSKSFFI